METGVTFLDCPAWLDNHGTARCGLPAEVEYRYVVESTDGPLESAKIRCPNGHWFNAPLESLLWDEDSRATAARGPNAHSHAARGRVWDPPAH
jgi:hypothetical protein